MTADRELKWGPFVLWHRVTRGHWFVPLGLLDDYCRVCLKKATDALHPDGAA